MQEYSQAKIFEDLREGRAVVVQIKRTGRWMLETVKAAALNLGKLTPAQAKDLRTVHRELGTNLYTSGGLLSVRLDGELTTPRYMPNRNDIENNARLFFEGEGECKPVLQGLVHGVLGLRAEFWNAATLARLLRERPVTSAVLGFVGVCRCMCLECTCTECDKMKHREAVASVLPLFDAQYMLDE